MKKTLFAVLSLLTANSLMTLPSQASTMPKAEANRSAFVLGIGPSAALDININPHTTLGLSAGLPFLVNGFSDMTSRYDARLVFDLFRTPSSYNDDGNYSRFYLSGVLGAWGDVNFRDVSISRWIGIEVGLALAYRFTSNLTGRINLVPGYNFFGGANTLVFQNFFPPAAGAEIGWQVTNNFEATLGYNGQGDILGLRFRL